MTLKHAFKVEEKFGTGANSYALFKVLNFSEYIMWKATACMKACHKQYLYNKEWYR